jgi:hypothetical protein
MMIGSNIRPICVADAKLFADQLAESHWLPGFYLVVSQDGEKYRILEGGHRWYAIKNFLRNHKDDRIREEWENFLIPCVVLPIMTHKRELAIGSSN